MYFSTQAPQITISGPNGKKILTKIASTDLYSAILGGGTSFSGEAPAPPLYLVKGTYTATAQGGADVGPFTATLNVPDPLVWTNASSVSNVTRSSGQLITWSGGDPTGTTIIGGGSLIGTLTSPVGAGTALSRGRQPCNLQFQAQYFCLCLPQTSRPGWADNWPLALRRQLRLALLV